MLGALFALMSAATFALNNASVRRGVLSGSVLQAMAITVPIGVPLFFIATVATGYLGALAGFSPQALGALAIAGLLHFVWGRYWNYLALRAIGLNLAAPIQQVNLVFTLAIAVWLLGEALTPFRILGIVLILYGPTLLMREAPSAEPRRDADSTSGNPIGNPPGNPIGNADAGGPAAVARGEEAPAFVPRRAEGYLFAVLSATGYGLSPVFIRLGLHDKSLGASLAGGLIAYATATAAMALFLLWPGQLRRALAVKPEAAKWFTFSGFMVCASQMFLFMALTVAPVTVVSPINRLTVLFRLHFSRLLNPRHEVFGSKVVLATVISLAGAVSLSLSVDMVASLLPAAALPPLRWHWPQ